MSVGASFLAGATVAQERIKAQGEAAKRKAAAEVASNSPADTVAADMETPLSFGQTTGIRATTPIGPLGAPAPQTPQQAQPEQMPAAAPVAQSFDMRKFIDSDNDMRFARGYAQRLRRLGYAEDAIKIEKDSYDLAEKRATMELTSLNRGVDAIKAGATEQGLHLINGMRRDRSDPVFIAAFSQPLTTSEYGRLKTIFGDIPIPNLPRDGSIVGLLDNRGQWQYINSDSLKATLTPPKEQFKAKADWDEKVMNSLLDMYKATIDKHGSKDTLNDLIKRLLERQISADRIMQKEKLSPEEFAKKYPNMTFAGAEANILQKWYTNQAQQAAAQGLAASLPTSLGMMKEGAEANIAAIQQFAATASQSRAENMPGIVVPKTSGGVKSEAKYKVKTKGNKTVILTESELREALKKQNVKDIEGAIKKTPKAD